MSFRLEEEQLKEILSNNPALRVSGKSILKKDKSISFLNIEKEANANKKNKVQKYRNKKQYEYKCGIVSENKSLQDKYGKIVAVYDSAKEYTRWKELIFLLKMGKIFELERQFHMELQPKFIYEEKTINSIFYKADFKYISDGKTIIEDVKGLDKNTGKFICTKDFNLKWKLLMYKFPDFTFILV